MTKASWIGGMLILAGTWMWAVWLGKVVWELWTNYVWKWAMTPQWASAAVALLLAGMVVLILAKASRD